jgi:arsenate reductase
LPSAEFVDVRADGVPETILQRSLAEFGEKLLNTRSTTWRQLEPQEREKAPLDLLLAHPTLMKRPLIEDGGQLYLGWTPETRQALGVA